MTKLTIITINRNNAAGLERTMQSVLDQTCRDFEYVVVDGASTDGSVSVIERFSELFGNRMKWVSEPDSGIYNAMNKGMRMACGDYYQILNSGDSLADKDVTGRMLQELENNGYPSMMYGNMVKCFPDGHMVLDKGFEGKPITKMSMYTGTVNHNPTYIHSSLFDKYGAYDENLKIVSDWKWFMKAIVIGGEKPVYADIDVTLFDMTGISETNTAMRDEEKNEVLDEMFPEALLDDYRTNSFLMIQMLRLKRHKIVYGLVWLIERCLFKWEKYRKHSADKRALGKKK